MLELVVEHVLVRRQQVLGVLQGRWHPVDPALEPADPQPRVTVEDAAEDVLGEHARGTASTLIIMPTTTLLNSHGVFGGVSPMWWETGKPGLLDLVPHRRSSRCCRSRSTLPSSSLPGLSGIRNVLRPSDFSSASVRRAPFGSHQLISPTP